MYYKASKHVGSSIYSIYKYQGNRSLFFLMLKSHNEKHLECICYGQCQSYFSVGGFTTYIHTYK